MWNYYLGFSDKLDFPVSEENCVIKKILDIYVMLVVESQYKMKIFLFENFSFHI